MNVFIQQLINQKINSITVPELVKQAEKNQIPLTESQAKKVVSILKTEKIDVGNAEQVERLLTKLQTETDSHVASTIQQLLQQYSHLLP
ncbi:DUF2624 domain-containing protein [Alkalicoccobacillus murimartini]|uniref:DUF2624 domain-containing protein n=1 Tax=Alkalicoccobacillus murimartini TaxID=171685 RepID=A0ABT9YCI8_9BACI|nr:DUF2624 domain-containing protein [Alkalicoccobacillus murimartini]MDQ0205564.1 hypothetical protein [Alkalicoccobacillus murimartini]